MDKSNIAEWIIARVSDRPRASAIVGDLLEQSGGSRLAFSFAVGRVVVAMSWRWAVGGATAFLSIPAISWFYTHFTVRRMLIGFSIHHRREPWMMLAAFLPLISMCVCTQAAISVSVYGFRDRVAMASTIFAAGLIVSNATVWMPHATLVIPLTLLLLPLCFLFDRDSRRALLVLSFTGLAYGTTLMLTCYAEFRLYLPSRSRFNPRMDAVMFFAVFFIAIAVQAKALATARRWLLPVH
jgi:hypothetical protein